MLIPFFCFMDLYEQKLGIKTWAEEDRPREKLLLHGRRHLTDAELIAILIGSGNRQETAVDLSKRILCSSANSLDELGKKTISELSQFKGIGEAKAISIIAALELGRRRKETPSTKNSKISSSRDAYEILAPLMTDLQHEEFWILILNRANLVKGKLMMSKGGQAGTVVDPKMIFKTALDWNAASLIIAHNHPSGNLKPSAEDLKVTKRLVEAGKMLDMPVLDHLIIADRLFFSFADEGLL